MELISSFISPIILESTCSCDTSWITSFSSLALKRSLRMELSGKCSWSEEQMIWMGEFSRFLPSTSGRLRNCWLSQAGLPDCRSGSSFSSFSIPSCFSGRGRGCALEGAGCCWWGSEVDGRGRGSLVVFEVTQPMIQQFKQGGGERWVGCAFYNIYNVVVRGGGGREVRAEVAAWQRRLREVLPDGQREDPGEAGGKSYPPEVAEGQVVASQGAAGKRDPQSVAAQERGAVGGGVRVGGRVLHDNVAVPEQQPQGQVLPYLEFLRSRIRITEIEAKYYMLQIIDGLDYVHANGIVHRDIKLGNIFLNYKMEIKLGDFGLSTRVKSSRERRYTTCGTPNYIAPEILNETGHSFEVDIWAVGIMLYALLVGKPPFESETVDETYRRIKNNQYDFPKQIPLSSEAKNLIKLLLDPNPKTRISLQQIKGCDFLFNQKIPPSMPPYTISLPPQSSFLKQYGSDKGVKLSIYPRKISATLGAEDFHNSNANLKHKPKLSRVLSCDKNIFKLSSQSKSGYLRDHSQLNRGVIFNTRMKNHLHESRNTLQNELSPRSSRYEQDGNEIICYYDMSAKYGIGYLLSNGNFGVVFNDQTSLTALTDQCWLYYDKKPMRLSLLPESLRKKSEILRLCTDKLGSYKEKNVLIPFTSQVYAQSFVRSKDMFIMKLSNGVLQFFWSCDVLTVKGYKWIKWRIGREEGECGLNSAVFPVVVEGKVSIVREFLRRESEKTRKRRLL